MNLNLEHQSAAAERIWAATRGVGSSGQPPRCARAAAAATAGQLLVSGCLRSSSAPSYMETELASFTRQN